MDFIAIASLVALVGSGLVVLLMHQLIGFRPRGREAMGVSLEAGSALESSSAADAVDPLDQMWVLVRSLQEQLVEREALDELRWQMLEELRDELRQVRARTLKLRRDFDRRLHQSDESRRSRQRELERQHGRELGWRRERELEQARWQGQEERPLASPR